MYYIPCLSKLTATTLQSLNQGPCGTADNGGPLINTRGSTNASDHVVMGIASFGQGCDRYSRPYVYTRISAHNHWIRLQICRFTRSPPAYCVTAEPSVSPSLLPSVNPTSTLENPYFVLLSDTATGPSTVRCGGVLIHSNL